ncbi:MAG TPA: TIM-barrel domain-containing protein [Candidatus Acidoferrales bacterium]|nr:TIM-barrel domain-containing protein [Candidatus Acidoferrales bacterium]
MFYGLILLVGINSMLNDSGGSGTPIGRLRQVQKTPESVIAVYDSGKARVEIFKSGIVHLTIQRGDDSRKSFAVIEEPEELSRYKIDSDKKAISVSLKDGAVKYLPESMNLSYVPQNSSNQLDLIGIQFEGSGLVATFDIHGARNFYGLGEKTLPYNKYGTCDTMWNSDFPAYSAKLDPLYESIPFLLKADTSGAYGLFFDNTFRSVFDVGASDSGKLVYKSAGGALELYLITGKNSTEIVQRFSELTGKMAMPPIWALGYQQSRWSYYPEEKVLDLARGFRKREIPCDVIYLDINYMDGYRCFTWSPKDFPTPKNMLDTLHDLGFKIVTIIDPGIKNESGYRVHDSGVKEDVFVKSPDGKYFAGQVWPGDCVFPDFFNEKTRKWWGSQYEFLLDYGVDGFWNDMNEPSVFNGPNKTFPLDVVHRLDVEDHTNSTGKNATVTHAEVHNVYGMQMARASREGLEKLEPDERPFVLTRANYAGGQRYAAMWTGDNFSSFAHLKLALSMFLNIGVSGQPFVGSDVGGFIGNPSAELFSRWLELGVFTPFFRTHSVWDSKPREPWAFDSASMEVNRGVIERRYELLPEIYTAFRDASENGLPIVRPLYLDFPEDQEAYNISDEFLFGDNLLVAPVVDSGTASREIYLPGRHSGDDVKWRSFYDGEEIQKGWQSVGAPLGKTPIFLRDGTILLTQSLIQSTSQQADTLILKIYGTNSAKGSSYFDDGETMSYKRGDFLVWNITYEYTNSHGILNFDREGTYQPRYRFLSVDVSVLPEQRGRVPAHKAVMKTSDGRELVGEITDIRNGVVRVTFPFTTEVRSIVVE